MDKKDIMDYVFNSIHNTNPVILNQKLDEFSSNSETKNAVQYVAQELTEDQQMQARANLGLYGKSYDYETIATYDYYAYFQAQNPSRITCQNMDTYISAIDGIISTSIQEGEYHIPMAGRDRIYWHGNSNLIPDNHWNSEMGEKNEKNIPTYPLLFIGQITNYRQKELTMVMLFLMNQY